jgi:predicted phosphodiesterase
MRYLIISDIHANLTAFKRVLEDAQGKWDVIWCLGDIIGYGPDPNECVALLRESEHISLSGNHDWAVLNRLDLTTFNDEAHQAISWTQSVLLEESRVYLEELPSTIVQGDFTLAHGSPRHPVWEYLVDEAAALANFAIMETQHCLVGHSHTPLIFVEINEKSVDLYAPMYDQPLNLEGGRLIINPGSVGQPRDYDPRAAYAILDTDKMTLEHRRVVYNVRETQDRMASHGLPTRLINRLQYGW